MIKVLIIDDDRHAVKILEKYLVAYKYQPIAALTVEEGVDLAAKEIPQIIIIDYDMKPIKAPEICNQLRAIKKLKDCQILIFSDVVHGLLEKECVDAGAQAIAYKPTVSDLLEIMEEIREGKKLSWGEAVDEDEID